LSSAQKQTDSAKKLSPSPSKKQIAKDTNCNHYYNFLLFKSNWKNLILLFCIYNIQLDPCYFEQIDGVYEGDVDFNYRKEGLGMFISDSGEAYIGKIQS